MREVCRASPGCLSEGTSELSPYGKQLLQGCREDGCSQQRTQQAGRCCESRESEAESSPAGTSVKDLGAAEEPLSFVLEPVRSHWQILMRKATLSDLWDKKIFLDPFWRLA